MVHAKKYQMPSDCELRKDHVPQFESKVAKRWRTRRVFIAGDAAHLTPPFMGQGMCAGVRDASNLAWKLALAVSGQIRDTEALLDTYQVGTARGQFLFT